MSKGGNCEKLSAKNKLHSRAPESGTVHDLKTDQSARKGKPKIALIAQRTTATACPLSPLRACLENPVRCRSRREEAQISMFVEYLSFNHSLRPLLHSKKHALSVKSFSSPWKK